MCLTPIELGPVMEGQRVMMGDSLTPSMGRWPVSLWRRRLGLPSFHPSPSLPACLGLSWAGGEPSLAAGAHASGLVIYLSVPRVSWSRALPPLSALLP